MVGEIRQFISPEKAARPTFAGQLGFTALVNACSAALWWAVSGRPWVAMLTLSAQVGGPALVALAGVLLGRRAWYAPVEDFDPRRVATWAYFTGALLAAVALVLKQFA
jgi:hypothetical protein